MSKDSEGMRQLKDFIAGAVGGVALVLSGHPLDTMKVRLQTGGSQFTGLGDVFRQTWRKEGFKGFYKGMASPLAGVAAMNAVLFYAWSGSCRLLKKMTMMSFRFPNYY